MAKELVLLSQQLDPVCATLCHGFARTLLLILTKRLSGVEARPALSVDKESDVAAAQLVALLQHPLDDARSHQEVGRLLIATESFRNNDEDSGGFPDADARLLLARHVHVGEARQVHKAVATLEDYRRKKHLNLLDKQPQQVLLVVELRKLATQIGAVEMERLAAAKGQVEALSQHPLELVAHTHLVLGLGQSTALGQLVQKTLLAIFVRFAGFEGVVEAPDPEQIALLLTCQLLRQLFVALVADERRELERLLLDAAERAQREHHVDDPAVAAPCWEQRRRRLHLARGHHAEIQHDLRPRVRASAVVVDDACELLCLVRRLLISRFAPGIGERRRKVERDARSLESRDRLAA
mmetsp:Transcript_13095/g.25402  ORF Transcript_13095/g.25402 Transcript_13095/m.25402 type:complete len:353 (+) Transcript_13095:1634-2692(+)